MGTEIDKYLEKCDFYDYTNEKKVHEYTGMFLYGLNMSAEKILRDSLNKKATQDFQQLCSNKDLQNIALYNEETLKILTYIENKYIVKKKLSHHLSIIHKLLQKSVLKLSAIITLYCSKNFDDFYSSYRNIYEHFVLFSYIIDNEDISDAFIDHSFMTYYQMKKDLGTATQEELNKISEYETQYGEMFKYDYGWFQNKINKKNKAILTDIIAKCNNNKMIDEYAFNYSYSCKFVHATTYSAYAEDNSNVSPLIRNIIEMIHFEMNAFLDYLKEQLNNKEYVLLKKLVLELSKIVYACIQYYEKK